MTLFEFAGRGDHSQGDGEKRCEQLDSALRIQ